MSIRSTLITIAALLLMTGCSRSSGPGTNHNGQASQSGQGSQASNATAAPVQGTESSAGGGNAVICFKDAFEANAVERADGALPDELVSHIEKIEMLDLFYAEQPHGPDAAPTRLVEPLQDETAPQYLQRLDQRLGTIIPFLSETIRDGKREVNAGSFRWNTEGLKRIHDENDPQLLPARCTLVTMAAQNYLGSNAELIIDRRLYEHPKHTTLSRAVLLLHEYLYLMARRIGHATHSGDVRRAVSFLLTRNPDLLIEDLLAALNGMLPSTSPQFRLAADDWLENKAKTLVEEFRFDIFPSFQSEPEERENMDVLRSFDRFFRRDTLRSSCITITPRGCRERVQTLSDDVSLNDNSVQGDEADRAEAISGLLKMEHDQTERLKELLRERWEPMQYKSEMAGVFPASDPSFSGQFENMLELMQSSVAAIPNHIVIDPQSGGIYIELTDARAPQVIARDWKFLLHHVFTRVPMPAEPSGATQPTP